MNKKILIHYNEIAIKGKNREYFENRLLNNIRDVLKRDFPESKPKAQKLYGRFLVEINQSDEKIKQSLKNIFGIANFSFIEETEQDIEKIKTTCFHLIKDKNFQSFRVTSRRSNKNFPLSSQEINENVGSYLFEKLPSKSVSLKAPDVECFIEIVDKKVFIYTEKIKGAGGMPVGTGGKALTLLSGGIDSPVAAYFGVKRGVKMDFIHFHTVPHTSPASVEKVKQLAQSLHKFQFASYIYLVPFAEIQQEIMMKTPAKLRVILYRRMMMRIAEELSLRKKYLALYTGESVGQVASQTLENIRAVEESITLPILRPLIGMDKEEIIQKSKEIESYEISILPHEDCCTRFIPKHPETKAKLEEVKEAEKNLDPQRMIAEALEKMEIEKI